VPGPAEARAWPGGRPCGVEPSLLAQCWEPQWVRVPVAPQREGREHSAAAAATAAAAACYVIFSTVTRDRRRLVWWKILVEIMMEKILQKGGICENSSGKTVAKERLCHFWLFYGRNK